MSFKSNYQSWWLCDKFNFATSLWWHTSSPTCKINYVNQQHNYVNMRLFYVAMLLIYVDMQHNYVNAPAAAQPQAEGWVLESQPRQT